MVFRPVRAHHAGVHHRDGEGNGVRALMGYAAAAYLLMCGSYGEHHPPSAGKKGQRPPRHSRVCG